MIYYNKRIQIKISNRERCVRPGLGDTLQKLPIVSRKSCGFCFLFPTNISRVCAQLLQLCPTLCDPMGCSPPDPLSMGFSRQEYWSGLCPPPEDLPDLGIEPTSLISPSLAGGFFGSLPLAPPGKPNNTSPVLLISVEVFYLLWVT